METVFADFHTHTTASDSSRTLKELLSCFIEARIQYASITDHDTLAVYQSRVLEEVAAELGLHIETANRQLFQITAENGQTVTLLSGAEFSTKYTGKNQHLVGLGMRAIDDPRDVEYLDQLRSDRKKRIEDMILEIDRKREHKQGVYAALGERPLSVAEFYEDIGQEAMPTRLHLGAYLWKYYRFGSSARGAMNTGVNENLDSYRFSERAMATEDAIALIHKYGGIAIVPHLHRQSFSDMVQRGPAELTRAIESLQEVGLDGIEINPAHEQNPMYVALAKELNLICSIGTDDHGENGPTFYRTHAQHSSRVTLERRNITRIRERLEL
jgi:predicted metal-dependent phosphoesterase TrpH